MLMLLKLPFMYFPSSLPSKTTFSPVEYFKKEDNKELKLIFWSGYTNHNNFPSFFISTKAFFNKSSYCLLILKNSFFKTSHLPSKFKISKEMLRKNMIYLVIIKI